MNGPKIVIVALALLAVLFFVGVGVGASRDDEGGAPRQDTRGVPDWTRWFGQLLRPFSPKLELAELGGQPFAVGPSPRILAVPAAREPFRRTSVISDVCRGTISGLGVAGYHLALEGLAWITE